MIRWIKYKLTGNPLTKQEQNEYDYMKDIYQEDHVHLSNSEYWSFRRYWKILNRYNMEK